ncbi:MAG: lipopolysaccharide transport periplasmic protein LptA [Aquabacterium sp.]
MPLKMLVFPQSVFRSALTRALLPAVLVVAALPAAAVKADRDQPLSFAADAARVDEAQKLNILSGNVEISKGTMVVKADRVEIRQNADGTQSASAFGGAGGKAYFSQKRDGVNESIEGEAERVDYDGKADTVRFTGKAVMRRLKDARTSDEVSGQTIVYDNRTSVFQVLGSNTPGVSSGRVRGVITPRSSAEGARP